MNRFLSTKVRFTHSVSDLRSFFTPILEWGLNPQTPLTSPILGFYESSESPMCRFAIRYGSQAFRNAVEKLSSSAIAALLYAHVLYMH